MTPILTLTLSLLISGAPTGLQGAPLTCGVTSDAPAAVQVVSGGIGSLSVCVADCNPYPDVSCEATGCSAQNRNCNVGNRGWVQCNGYYTYCGPACPPICVEGEFRLVSGKSCCPYPNAGKESTLQQCQDGHWVTIRVSCRPSPQCPILP